MGIYIIVVLLGRQVVVYLVTKQMEVVKLQIMGWSDPLCSLLRIDCTVWIGGAVPQ